MDRIREEEDILDKLLSKEEIFWAHKSRISWLRWGNRNSKFFHLSTIERRTSNRITSLKNEDEEWVAGDDQIKALTNQFYSNLFSSSNPSEEDISKITEKSYLFLSEEAKDVLNLPFFRDEIKRAAFDLGKLKAPDPDGFQAGFYQKFWDLIENETLDAIFDFFNLHSFLEFLNQTFITLIPKVKNPETISQFRHISLCNAIYKIIYKTMTNRMKTIFPEIISPNQNAFVKGRLISDNIIIAHEILRFLRVGKSRSHHMALKIDMSKTYDRVKWPMIISMMQRVVFNAKWQKWVLECISLVSYRVLINGSPGDRIIPSRGIRQGDPISPFSVPPMF